jgi:hypothetical protein
MSALWLGTAYVYIAATANLSEFEENAMWALCGLAAAGTIFVVLLIAQLFIVPADLAHQFHQEFASAATSATTERVERVRELLTKHAATAPDANSRNTDTVDNWQRRAMHLLDTHLIPAICRKYIHCQPHCIQAVFDASRASFEAIAVNLSPAHLKD